MRFKALNILYYTLILNGYMLCDPAVCIDLRNYGIPVKNNSDSRLINEKDEVLRKLNISLKAHLTPELTENTIKTAEKILSIIDSKKFNDLKVLSDSYYLLGAYYLYKGDNRSSIRFLDLFVALKEKFKEYDERLSNGLFNLGLASSRIGDFNNYLDFSRRSLDLEIKLLGGSSPAIINTYTSVIIACTELQQYEEALRFADVALSIADKNSDSVSYETLALLYYNMGVCYSRLFDYSKAKIYLEQAESICLNNRLVTNKFYFNLINSLAITYGSLGQINDSFRYYEKGISLAATSHYPEAYNLVNSYSILLGKNGHKEKGEHLLADVCKMAKTDYGEDSQEYIEVLNNYAAYLREYKINNGKSIALYEKCIEYLDKNPSDNLLKIPVGSGYSLSLSLVGDNIKALSIMRDLLFPGSGKNLISDEKRLQDLYENPLLDNIKPDKKSLNLLRTKYSILKSVCKISPGLEIFRATSNTSELIVSVIEKMRLNIGQEQSRLILGEHYRDSYFNAISDLNLLYSETSDATYLEKAFIYSEKSKAAGLLTLAREMDAVNLNIPADLSQIERNLQRSINLLEVRINHEMSGKEPDTIMIHKWKENLLDNTRKKDSLVRVFEEEYPGYYDIRYNTNVAGIQDIPGIIGRDGNYLNYLASDTVLYIFIANRKNLKLVSVPVDSTFYNKTQQFRSLLSMPRPDAKARDLFNTYTSLGNDLYNILIAPVSKYLISDRIIISPDSFLSYLPFETLPIPGIGNSRFMFRELDYLLNKYDISYVYSATFMAESAKGSFSKGKGTSTIAFAPSYSENSGLIDFNSVQKTDSLKLSDLPYARQEAEFVSQITHGELYEGGAAKESAFKSQAGRFDIIHLAMHTIVNDKEPMLSTLIFSPENISSSAEDRYLRTYEVYGIPLKAKMVVLSSCNTGSGVLFSGEGVLSLARGFIYSGSKSVVMSMWEIDDKSGTEIVKMFYKNLKHGDSKSKALRKARIAFLQNADQLRSHPYFWSALVIYGDNSQLFSSQRPLFIALTILILLIGLAVYYFRKRRYS